MKEQEHETKCRYCTKDLPMTYGEIGVSPEGTTCPGCGTRYTPVVMSGVMGSGVEVWDDGPPKWLTTK